MTTRRKPGRPPTGIDNGTTPKMFGRVPDVEWERYAKAAARAGKTRSQWMREILVAAIESKPADRRRSRGNKRS